MEEKHIPQRLLYVLSFLTKVLFERLFNLFNTIPKADVYQIIQLNLFNVHIIIQSIRGFVKKKDGFD